MSQRVLLCPILETGKLRPREACLRSSSKGEVGSMRLPESCLATSLQRAPFEEEVERVDVRRRLILVLSAVNFLTFLTLPASQH